MVIVKLNSTKYCLWNVQIEWHDQTTTWELFDTSLYYGKPRLAPVSSDYFFFLKSTKMSRL